MHPGTLPLPFLYPMGVVKATDAKWFHPYLTIYLWGVYF